MNIDIVNRALLKLGENPISSENELPHGKSFKLIYDDVRRSLLSMYYWRFAVKKVNLAPLDEAASSIKKYVFQKPSDLISIIGIGDYFKIPDLRDFVLSSGERYLIIGDKIESNLNPLPLVYIVDEEDTTKYPPLFKDAFSLKLAMDMTIKIHQNFNLYQLIEQEFSSVLSAAMQNNDIIQDTQSFGDNSWVSIREGWQNGL